MSRASFLLCLSLLIPVASRAQTIVEQDSAHNNWYGTWSATTKGGRTLVGTWTATVDSATGTVTGTWALVDAQGTTRAEGGWSAAKTVGEWSGAWRAVIYGRDGEYTGTWTSTVQVKRTAAFADLFESAIQAVVSGTWRSGNNSGAWSIRSAK